MTRLTVIPLGYKPAESLIDECKTHILTGGQLMRVGTVLSSTLITYPLSSSSYRVISVKEEEEHAAYTVSLEESARCGCGDYVFNIGEDGGWCKHILRVWIDIETGILPPRGLEPETWLERNLPDYVTQSISYTEEEIRDATSIVRLLQEGSEVVTVHQEDFRVQGGEERWKKETSIPVEDFS